MRSAGGEDDSEVATARGGEPSGGELGGGSGSREQADGCTSQPPSCWVWVGAECWCWAVGGEVGSVVSAQGGLLFWRAAPPLGD